MTETKSPSELMFLFPEAQGTDLAFCHKQAIANCMDIHPYIIHHYFWSAIRFNRQEINYCLSVLTPTTILILKPKNPKETNYEDREMTKLVSFNLKDIQLIGHSKDSKVLLKVEGKDNNFNICYPNAKSGLNLQFAQCVYRNYSINFSVYKDQSFVEVRSDHMNNFPEVNIYLSPSQRFQFLYYSLCAENKVLYSHVIVKYVHSLIMRGVPIIDLNNVPIQLISHFKHGSNLKPFIQAISMMPFVTGFCCENITQPSLMDSIKMLFRKGSKVSILHVPHSGMETGISTLSRAVKKTTSLSYLNLEGNQFDDIDSINSVLSTIKKDLYYLNLSDTGLSADATAQLFITLQDFKKLQELSIAGCETNEAVFEQFNNYVTKLTATKKVNFNSIDISNTENANGFLDVINDHKLQLRSLKLRKITIGQETTGLLISIIKNSKTLRYLDLSETTISLENIANVINTIAKNNKLSHFHLILDSLNLTTGNLLPLFEAFLNGDLSKWSCLSFNSNNMKEPDLKNLIALLARMPNLHTLSIGGNFTSEMDKIGQILVKLRRIENLRELNLAGGDENKLGKNMLPLLDSLSTFPALESLDISNNDGGDVLYDKLKGIANPKKCGVHSLKIDKNRPTSIDIVQILIKLIKGTHILSLPFPTDDVESMLAAIKDPNDASIALNEYLKAENELFYIIDDNRIRKNLLPQLPFHPSPEIKKIIIKATQEMRDRLESDEEEPLHHSLICLDYGLELPYNSLSIIAETIETDQSYKKSYKLYNSSNLYKFAIEPEEDFKVPTIDDLDSIPDMFSDDGKKGKKKRKSPSDTSSEEEQPKKKSKRSQKKSDSEDESSSEEEQPKKKSKRSQKKSDSEDEPPKKRSKRSQKNLDESSSEEEQPKKKSKRSQKKSDSEDESSSEEEQPKKKSKRSQKKSDDLEDEPPKKRSKRSQTNLDESSSEEEQPKKKSKRSQKNLDESDESSSDEGQEKKRSKRSQKVPSPSKEKKSSKPRVTFPDNDFEETPKGSNSDLNDHKPINLDDFSDDEIPATPTGTYSDDDELPSDRETKGSPNGSKNRPNHPKPDDPETVRENLSKMKKTRKK